MKTVINYDVARDIETHIHRIGRTGRSGLTLCLYGFESQLTNYVLLGVKGTAYTLILATESSAANLLIRNLQANRLPVPPELFRISAKVIL